LFNVNKLTYLKKDGLDNSRARLAVTDV